MKQETKLAPPGSPKLVAAAKKQLLAKARFDKLWVGFWVREAEPCTEERFWQLFPVFKEEVEQFVFGYKRSNGMEQAAEELARKTVTGESERHEVPYTYLDVVGFAKCWDTLAHKVGQALDDLMSDYGDDGWSDFMDSVLFAGPEFYQRALASGQKGKKRTGFLEEEEVVQAIDDACENWVFAHPRDDEGGDMDQRIKLWVNLIRFGENYVGMRLEDGVKRYFFSLVRDTLTEAEQDKLAGLED